jgi:glycopeptide antibiotics resistance protein
VVTKVLLAMPVGALLQLVWLPQSRRGRLLQFLAVGLASVGLFLAVEVGQLMLPTRLPDQTDVYIGTAGAILGMVVARLVSRAPGHHELAASPRTRPEGS